MLRNTARQRLISNVGLRRPWLYSTLGSSVIAGVHTIALAARKPLIASGFSNIESCGKSSSGSPIFDACAHTSRSRAYLSVLHCIRTRTYSRPASPAQTAPETPFVPPKQRHRPHEHWSKPNVLGGLANNLASVPTRGLSTPRAQTRTKNTKTKRTKTRQKEDAEEGAAPAVKEAVSQGPESSRVKKSTKSEAKQVLKSRARPKAARVTDAGVEAPADLEFADDVEDIEEYDSLTAEELAEGPQPDHSAVESADFDIDAAVISYQSALNAIDSGPADSEEYAPELIESMKATIQDIRGIPVRGTKTNPIKGNWDPVEIDSMAQDREAGAEDSHAILRDSETEEEIYEERVKGSVRPDKQYSTVQGDKVEKPRTKKRRKASLLKISPEAEADGGISISSDMNVSLSVHSAAALTPQGGTEGVLAGSHVVGEDNPPLSRFNWWERATSRHALSRELAKRNTPLRRNPRVHRLQSKDHWYQPLKDYTDNFTPLIEAEHLHEETVIRQRLDAINVEQLVTEGYCLNNLQATRDPGSQAGRPTYTFAFGGKGNQRFTWNRFNPGTAVIISPAGGTANPLKKQQSKTAKSAEVYNAGSVISKTQGNVKVSFDEPLAEENISQTWRLDIWTSDIVMRRAKEALATLHHDPMVSDRCESTDLVSRPPSSDAQLAVKEEKAGEPKQKRLQTMLAGTALRSVLLDAFTSKDSHIPSPTHLNGAGFFADNQLIQSWCKRQLVEGREPLRIDGDPLLALNTSQRKAIATMLSSNISLVQGPPGTGKTRTIIEALHLLKVHWEVPYPILVSAYTNTACDNLAEGMHNRGLKVLRYGSQSRIREDLRELTLDWYLEQHPQKIYLDRLKAETYTTAKDDPKREVLRRQLFGLERRMMHDVLLNVDVVCATCISSRGRLLDIVDFPVVFLDEASMATEPNALIPLTKGCQHATLIGDHRQLPPLVVSKKAAEGALHISLFERLINENKVPSVMLDTQYRMHPDISAFPNKAFYDSRLKDGTVDGKGIVETGLKPPKSVFTEISETGTNRTVTFIHHWGLENARAKSVENESEAKIVHEVIVDLLSRNRSLMGRDIGVISPYAGQISRIVNELRHDPKRQAETWSILGPDRGAEVDEVEVHTVDGFEGREKQVILFSTTRSNPGDSIGFLKDWRRMNVGLTRAKSGLIIIGNRNTLGNARRDADLTDTKSGADCWRELLRDLASSGAIVDVECEGDRAMWGDRETDQQNEQLGQEIDGLDDSQYGQLYETPAKRPIWA